MINFNTSIGKFENIDQSSKYYKLFTCLQELQLWLGENPMDADKGIDYFAVFENRKLLRNELTRVLDNYRNSFSTIDIVSLNKNDDGDTINVELYFQLNEGSNVSVELSIKSYM